MTSTTDERRRERLGPEPVAMVFYLHNDGPERRHHQMAAQVLYEARMLVGDPEWRDLPRQDRVPLYSFLDGMV